jgi:hypothetical protein
LRYGADLASALCARAILRHATDELGNFRTNVQGIFDIDLTWTVETAIRHSLIHRARTLSVGFGYEQAWTS